MKKILLSITLVLFALLSIRGSRAELIEGNIYINNVEDPVTVLELQSEFSVYDDFDGDLTDSIYIIVDNYTNNENVLGDFVIVFGVTDSVGAVGSFSIIVRNVDVVAPVFVIEAESTLNIPQYSLLGANLPQIEAIDSFEGELTSQIAIVGLDLIDTDVVGSYDLIYTVNDSSGNEISETFVVNVVDSISPVINGVDEIIKRSNYILDGQFFLKYFSAEDDHDGIISNRIEVISNAYIGNANKPGTYEVVISVSDVQGNKANHTLVIKVVDSMIPNLIIDQYYWEIPNNTLLKDTDFINTLKAIGDLPNYTYVFTTTFDNYSNFFERIDKYQKNFELISSSGNEYERDIILDVVESEFNIVEQEPGFFEVNTKYIFGGIAFVVIGIFFFIGIRQSLK